MSRIENLALVLSALFFLGCTQMKSNPDPNNQRSASTPSPSPTPNPSPSPSPSPNPAPTPAPTPTPTPSPTGTLSEQYPRDMNISNSPDVVWAEHFTAGSLDQVLARYDQVQNRAGIALEADVPANSSSQYSIRLTSTGTNNATDFYKRLPGSGHDEVYVRWYAKYQPGINWHHSGVWFGGYYPAQNYPSPRAGIKPNGDDRFSISIEPMGTADRFDFYNYWMNMHHNASTTTWYGNLLINQNSFTVNSGSWNCIEVRLKLNTDMNSATGAMLELWKNNTLVQSFNPTGPAGYWVHDKYCTTGNSTPQCAYSPTAQGPVNLQFRTTNNLNVNYFWPQNYITNGSTGSLWYANMVMATRRIGCLVP